MSGAGCAMKPDRTSRTRQVQITEFAQKPTANADAPRREATSVANDQSANAPPPATAETEVTAAAGPDSAEPSPDSSPPPPPAPIRRGEQLVNAGDMVVIDSVIGQVSGRPIFADELLEPIADQLRREAERSSAAEFQARARQIISNRLNEVILNELLIAEAEAALTPQQQQGLLAFVRQMQEKTIATGQGSRTVTEERLLEEVGMTLQQYTERERSGILIRFLLDRRVNSRAIVSWKDVQREFNKRQAEFNPPATVTLKRVRIPTSEQPLIEQTSQRLAAGEPFDAVVEALDPSMVTTLDPLHMGPGGMADVEISETYKPHLVGLTVGQTSPPIQLSGRTEWLHVAAIDQAPRRTLYDVQRQLENELRLRREAEERNRYINTLFARGIHDELNEMAERVLLVALLRYGK